LHPGVARTGCGDAERKPQMLAGASGNGFGGDGGSSATSGGTTSAGTGGSMPVTLDLVCDHGPLTIIRQFNGTAPTG